MHNSCSLIGIMLHTCQQLLMRRSCCSQWRRASRARDERVAAHGTGQQYKQWRIRQL